MSARTETAFPHWFRRALVLVCLASALLLRLWHLTTVPPGFHLDEAMDAHLARQVLQGRPFLYTTEGWGREGLYYTLVAPLLYLLRDGILGTRLTSAIIGVALTGIAGLVARRLFDPNTGVLAAGWMGLTFWPVFVSRVGVRNILLAALLGLAMLAFWWAWRSPPNPTRSKLVRFGLAGLLGGLCFYTYQPSRVIPLIYAGFLAHAALFHRPSLKANSRGLLVGGGVLVLTALPLVLFLSLHPGAEGAERTASLEPLTRFLQGDPSLLGANMLAVLRMFTVRGDPLFTYNLPGRPIFPTPAALPFYLGLLVCLRRWRDPACALVGLWLAAALVPTMTTVSAPHFFRSIGALVPAMILPAVGLATAVRFLRTRWGNTGLWAGCLVTLLLLGHTAWLTWQDYFDQWANLDQVAMNYRARETAVVHYLRADAGQTPTVAGSRFAEDAAPFIVASAFFEPPPPVRWTLPSTALVFPVEQPEARFILLNDSQVDGYLSRHFLEAETAPHDVAGAGQWAEWLVFYRLRPGAADAALPEMEPPRGGPWLGPPGIELPESPGADLVAAHLPVEFQQRLALLQCGLSSHRVSPGETMRLVTQWRVLRDGWPGNLAMFAHLVDTRSQVVAQQDQFGYPVHSWRAGDVIVQVHDLVVDPSAPPGVVWLQIGFYERHIPGRWTVTDRTGSTTSDRLLLDQVEIAP